MSGPDRHRPRRRGWRPEFERVELRQLPTGILASMAASSLLPAARGKAASPAVATGGGSATGGDTSTGVGVPGSAFRPNTNAAPIFQTPPGRPTRATRAQARFLARFDGQYDIGPGRTDAESLQLYLRGAGGSNQFLHGSLQLRYVVPTDPAVAPVGVATLLDRNINNGSQLGLDLTAVPGQTDRFGRVHRFTWTIDTNFSSGYYASANGQGTLTIAYGPRSPGRSGVASVLVRGQILSPNVAVQTTNSDLDPG